MIRRVVGKSPEVAVRELEVRLHALVEAVADLDYCGSRKYAAERLVLKRAREVVEPALALGMRPGRVWRREMVDGWTFYRRQVARHGQRLALVVGATTDGRWQLRAGGADRDTREIAEAGDLLATVATVGGAKRAAARLVAGEGA